MVHSANGFTKVDTHDDDKEPVRAHRSYESVRFAASKDPKMVIKDDNGKEPECVTCLLGRSNKKERPTSIGLRESGKNWYDTLCKELEQNGFKQSNS